MVWCGGFREGPDDPGEQRGPGNADEAGDAVEAAGLGGVGIVQGDEGENAQDDENQDDDGRGGAEQVEVKGDHVPERGETEKAAVVGLDIGLGEAIGAGEERKEQPVGEVGRHDARLPDQEQGEDGVGEEIGDVIEASAVELGKHEADLGASGEPSVGGVDERCQEHPGVCLASAFGSVLEDRRGHRGGADEAQRRIKVDGPGEDDSRWVSAVAVGAIIAHVGLL